METGARTSWSDRSRIVAYITIAIRLRQDYDTSYTTIRRRIQLRHNGRYRNYDSTAIRLRQEKWAWSLDVKDVNHGDTWQLSTRYSNSIQTLQTFISVVITFVIIVPKGSFWLVQIYEIFNFLIVHKSCLLWRKLLRHEAQTQQIMSHSHDLPVPHMRCPAYCHVIGYTRTTRAN